VLAWQSYITQEQQALRLQREVAQRVAAQVSAFLHEPENQLRFVSQVEGLPKLDRDKQRGILSELLPYQRVFEELVLLDHKGHEQIRVSRNRPAPTVLGDRAETDEFVIPQTRGQVYYSPIRFEATTGEPLMSIAVPLLDARTGLVDGVLASEVRIRAIWDLIAGIRVSPGQSVYIVDAQNTVVAHRNPSVVLRGTNFAAPTQDGVQPGLNGARSVLAVEKARFEGQELNIVVEQTWPEALAMAINSLYIIMTVLGATFVVSGF